MRLFSTIVLLFLFIGCDNKKQNSRQSSDTAIRDVHLSVDTSLIFTGKPLQNKIIEQVQQIDMLLITDSLQLENEDFMEQTTDGGGSLTGYFFKNELVKLREWIGLSYGIVERTFYFDKDNVISGAVNENYFLVDSNGTNHSKFDDYFRGDYLFADGKLVDKSTFGNKRFDTLSEKPEKDFFEAAGQLKVLLLQKRIKK